MRSSPGIRATSIPAIVSHFTVLFITLSTWAFLTPSADAQSLPPITDLRLEEGELRWTAPANVSRYSVRFYTGETTDRNKSFGGCSQGGMDRMVKSNGEISYCGWKTVSITQQPGTLERLADGSSTPYHPTNSFVVYYFDASGRQSEVSNVVVFGQSVPSESLQLWGPTSERFFRLTAGQTMLLTAGADSSLSPILTNVKTDQLYCRGVPYSYGGSQNMNAKWECTALRSGTGNSEVYFTIGNQRSNTIVIQVDPPQSLPAISDLTIENGELRWTAPVNVSKYSVRFYTGETTNRSAGFHGCGGDIYQMQNPNSSRYCAGEAISISKIPGRLERLRLTQTPVKSFVVTYWDSVGRQSEVSNVAVYRSNIPAQPVLMSSEGSSGFVRLQEGQRVSLTSNVPWGTSLTLQGVKTDQLRCVIGAVSTSHPVKWDCTALRSLTGTQGNSEAFFMIDGKRSNSIVIQVDPATQNSLPAISDLRIEDDELRWTAPQNVSRYYVSFYTGETTNRSSGFYGCGGRIDCIGDAVSISHITGLTERLRLRQPPVKSFIVTYSDASGRKSEVSNVAVYRKPVLNPLPTVRVTANNFSGPIVSVSPGSDVSIEWTSTNTLSCAVASKVYSAEGLSSNSSIIAHHLPVGMTHFTITCLSNNGGLPKTVAASITVKVLRTSDSSSSVGTGTIPPAGYEDEVLTNIETYRNPFPDTNINQLSGKAAAELYRRAVIGGFPDGQFKGDRPVNRAEAAKFLLLARFGSVNDMQNNGRFPDVLSGQWYTKFVLAAAEKGIIQGHPSGLFKPADPVNTAEFLKMMTRTFDIKISAPDWKYTDIPPDSWYADYVDVASDWSLFPSRKTRLYPERFLTREEVAVAIYQYLQNR